MNNTNNIQTDETKWIKVGRDISETDFKNMLVNDMIALEKMLCSENDINKRRVYQFLMAITIKLFYGLPISKDEYERHKKLYPGWGKLRVIHKSIAELIHEPFDSVEYQIKSLLSMPSFPVC